MSGEPSTRVPAGPPTDENAKALSLLIHDLRAPLSVAQGYLRLLQQNRLEAEADRVKAVAQTMEALGRIGRLCEDAAAFIAEPPAAEALVSRLEMSRLVEQLREACAERCAPLTFTVEPVTTLTGTICGTHLEGVIRSLAVILCAVRRSTRNEFVRVSVLEEEKEARFLLGCDEDRAALLSRPVEAFDPWRGGHGIALPLACRIVTAAGGRIWTAANGRGAVGIALPEEASVP